MDVARRRVRMAMPMGALLAMLSMTAGCASVTRGTYETMVIDSEPQGAKVRSSQG